MPLASSYYSIHLNGLKLPSYYSIQNFQKRISRKEFPEKNLSIENVNFIICQISKVEYNSINLAIRL